VSTTDEEIATACVLHMDVLVKAIPAFNGQAFHIYSEDDLRAQQKGLIIPSVGIVYDGMRAVQDSRPGDGRVAGGRGSTADLMVTVMAFFRNLPQGDADQKLGMIRAIGALRKTIVRSRSPTGHFWRFQVEAPVSGKDGLLVYVQKYATAVQLV